MVMLFYPGCRFPAGGLAGMPSSSVELMNGVAAAVRGKSSSGRKKRRISVSASSGEEDAWMMFS